MLYKYVKKMKDLKLSAISQEISVKGLTELCKIAADMEMNNGQ